MIAEPSDTPPLGADGKTPVTRDNRKYIAWKSECETYIARVAALDANQLHLFMVITLQCSQSVKVKVEASVGYEAAKAAHDCYWLPIKNICHKFEHNL